MSHPNFVSRATMEKFQTYFSYIQRYNKAFSLTRYSTFEVFYEKALIPALMLVPRIEKNELCLDVGSGAGLPGLVLGLMGFTVDLIELNTKKKIFLEEMKYFFNLEQVNIVGGNVKNLQKKYAYITSQAVADITTFLSLTENVSRETTTYLLPKSKKAQEEIDKALEKWNFEWICHNMNQHILVIITKVKRWEK